MDQDIYSQTNETNLLSTAITTTTTTTTTTTDFHQDKKESPTCTDTEILLNQPIIDPDCESSTLGNNKFLNNKQISLEDSINSELLEEEDNTQGQSLQVAIEKNANNNTTVGDGEGVLNSMDNSNEIINNHNNIIINDNISNNNNENDIPVNESDTLKSIPKQSQNNKNNNREDENNCVTSRDKITTDASAITTTLLQSDQIIKTIINNTVACNGNDSNNNNDNNDNGNLNIESTLPSSSTSVEAIEKGENLKKDELDKNNHENSVYNTNTNNNSDDNTNKIEENIKLNDNTSNDEVENDDLLNNSNDDTTTAADILISNEPNNITNSDDHINSNVSADIIQSTPSSSTHTRNDNTLNITNQYQDNDSDSSNGNKDIEEEEEEEEKKEREEQTEIEEEKREEVTIATTSSAIDQPHTSSKFTIDENENSNNHNDSDNENNNNNNNNNNLTNIPPISSSITTAIVTTATIDNLHNADTQTSEQSGNAPEQNTSIINAQQQDNLEAQVTQMDEDDRNYQLNPPSQPLLTTSSPPSSELTTTMATATSNSLSIFTTANSNNNSDYMYENNSNNNNNNNINDFSTNGNELHHHLATDQSPSPSLNRTDTYASDEQTLIEPRTRRIWESDRQTSECRKCNRKFNFLVRRHHCRRCGQIFCDRCSSHRIKLPVEEIVEDPLIATSHYPIIALSPQRVCDSCSRIPIKADSTSTRHISSSSSASPYGKVVSQLRPTPVNMKRSDSQQSLMAECPVCGAGLLGMRKSQQESHLNDCLNTGSPTVRPPRYIVYTITEGAAQLGDECPICFEEFQVGNKIARMVCLCSYHKHCLRDWLERGKGCPIHYDSYIQTT